tara:strand:+ start:572 stop:742 length:171 start_codon:yes stop_codon:yes gene_type:complete
MAKSAYKLVQKKSGRWAVKDKKGRYINGDAKAEILSKEGKIKNWKPKKVEEEAAES